MCLPENTTSEEQFERCGVVNGYSPIIPPDVHSQSLSAGDVVLILLIVFIILCCVLTVGYYNYRFCKDNEPPFQVPDWCPNFIFPRSTLFTRDITPGSPVKEREMKQQINPVGYYLYGDDN